MKPDHLLLQIYIYTSVEWVSAIHHRMHTVSHISSPSSSSSFSSSSYDIIIIINGVIVAVAVWRWINTSESSVFDAKRKSKTKKRKYIINRLLAAMTARNRHIDCEDNRQSDL